MKATSSHPLPAALRMALAAALLPAFLLAGCPYGSDFPLEDPASGILDAGLLGTWQPPPGSGEIFTLTILPAGPTGLSVTAENPEEGPLSYPAFVSQVGGERFLNLRDEGETGKWYLANYRLQQGRLLLRLVDEELLESRLFASGGELKEFLLQNLQDPRLYGGQEQGDWDWVLERQASGPAGS